MSKRKRLRRSDPARTAPIRRFSTLLRENEERRTKGDGAQRASGAEDTVAQAVRMGYSVVEEQIRRGRLAAQQVAGGASAFGRMPADASAMVGRLLRHSTDLVGLCFDLAGTLAQPSMTNAAGFAQPTPPPAGNATGAATSRERGSPVVIEITSKRKNRVTLDLWLQASADEVVVLALHALDSAKAPLKDIAFVVASSDEPARLKIAVPDSQPADVYSGLIVNRKTKTAAGTLSVCLYD